MSYSERGLTRREHVAVLSATTALAVVGSTQHVEAQNGRALLARAAVRFFGWAVVLYFVGRALTDDSHEDTKATTATTTTALPAPTDVNDGEKLIVARQIADRLRLEPQWARYIVNTHGHEIGRKVAAGTLTVWPQQDMSGQRIFDVTLTNPSDHRLHGAMHIVIRDTATNQEEFNYVFRGFVVAPRSTLVYPTPFYAPFTRPGVKEILLQGQDLVSTVQTTVLVLPVGVKRT